MSLFTIGNAATYDAALAAHARGERVALTKVGRFSPDAPVDYPGGSVWATAAAAQGYLDTRPPAAEPLSFMPAIYELDGDSESDTIASQAPESVASAFPYRDLLYDRAIIRRVS